MILAPKHEWLQVQKFWQKNKIFHSLSSVIWSYLKKKKTQTKNKTPQYPKSSNIFFIESTFWRFGDNRNIPPKWQTGEEHIFRSSKHKAHEAIITRTHPSDHHSSQELNISHITVPHVPLPPTTTPLLLPKGFFWHHRPRLHTGTLHQWNSCCHVKL